MSTPPDNTSGALNLTSLSKDYGLSALEAFLSLFSGALSKCKKVVVTTLIIQRYVFWSQHELEESVRSNSLSNSSAITLYSCSSSLPQGKLQCPLVSRFIALSYEQIDFPLFKWTVLFKTTLCPPVCHGTDCSLPKNE